MSLFVAGLPFGKAMGWGAQVRDTRALPLGLCVSRLWPQMLFGFAGFAWPPSSRRLSSGRSCR
ncbi:MAG: hypothetical protein HPM95_21795 [Alphaproteobacteria bacterium]|nr:hypothetical protein [Alphaproteobacteria bacterium]MBL6432568.1 hypothetical protein [Alphaproteobacteria bacterium]